MKGWPQSPLAEVASVGSGAGFPLDFQGQKDGEFPFLKVSDMNLPGNEHAIQRWNNSVSEEVRARLRATAFPPGSVIFPKIGAAIATNKKRLLIRSSCVDNNVMAVAPHADRLESDFLYYLLKTKNLSDFASDSNPPSIRKTVVESWSIPVPPLNEQRRIVDILARAEGIVRLRREAQNKAAEIIPSLFARISATAPCITQTIQEMLTTGLLSVHKDGNHGSLYPRSADFGTDGIPFLSATCVTAEGEVEHSEVKFLAIEKAAQLRHGWILPGDVLLAHNATVGPVGFYDGPYERALIGTSLTAFRPDPSRLEPIFLWAALRDSHFQQQLRRIMGQAVRNQVPITAQRELSISLPPIAVQRNFTDRCRTIIALKRQMAAATVTTEVTFNALLARAFVDRRA
jgi:type I restriction enzyme S subunit